VDTHCHLYWQGLIEQVEAVMARARAAQVEYVIVPGIDAKTSRLAQDLAARFSGAYFAAGLHPCEVEQGLRFDPEKFFAPFMGNPKIVAVGEIGLDFAHRRETGADPALEETQAAVFRGQVEWAVAHSLPVIIHNRDAGQEIVSLLRQIPEARGVFHCFDGSKRTLRFLAERDFFVSYSGNLTYANAEGLRATAALAPLDKVVVETDAPWLAPEPFRGGLNEPAHLMETVARLAQTLEKSPEIARINLLRNSFRLFNIDRSMPDGVKGKGHRGLPAGAGGGTRQD